MNSTSFWQIAGLVMRVVELMLYINSFNKYASKLKLLGNALYEKADQLFAAYKTLRDKTPAFFDYYRTLPDYELCDSAIHRNRGAALADYGKAMRQTLATVSGYTPLQRSSLANRLGQNAVQAPIIKRMMTHIEETKRRDEFIFNRWQAIISSPTHTAQGASVSPIIESEFQSLSAFGQGANASMFGMGASLYRMGVLK